MVMGEPFRGPRRSSAGIAVRSWHLGRRGSQLTASPWELGPAFWTTSSAQHYRPFQKAPHQKEVRGGEEMWVEGRDVATDGRCHWPASFLLGPGALL